MPQTFEAAQLASRGFRLGHWLVEPRLNRLTRDGKSIQVELKMMDVLMCLAEHAGELVERQALIDTVWATEFISENTLTRAIAELRNALGDDAKSPSYIETIHRRGYRLIAPVGPAPATVHPFPAVRSHAEEARSPYPGLAAFMEDDAEFFFGREAEVARLWRRITTRRLLAVIGPSGVGKSSLLRAGLIPSAPEGWGTLICHPGESPFAALARALAPEFEGDPAAIAQLVEILDQDTALALLTRWRQQHDEVLLIVDQFEELFTLNAPEVQARFATLLGKLAREAEAHVLLSMRDDFHYRCHEHEGLAPVFSDLTPVGQPSPEALVRAVSLPAARCGYSFEDDDLVHEMVREVADERAALPLLAFTLARLWQERDRERLLITRSSYEGAGGIRGALARHAESTIAGIGADRLPVVREVFRNLITAQGTRATRELTELKSVFDRLETADQVLTALVDARLLTTFETAADDGGAHRTVEIVHESLLAAWPRLVRWQSQDADAARLRDELRQAARTWDEHQRSEDFLWSGKAYREFALWRESYPGGLSQLEEAFAAAMTANAKRRQRFRRASVVAAFVGLLAVLTVVAVSRQQAVAQARRAEAARLLSLGRLAIEDDHTAALAWATASLELVDSAETRLLALDALWRGPTRFAVWPDSTVRSGLLNFAFSPDGELFAGAASASDQVVLWSPLGQYRTLLDPREVRGMEPGWVKFTESGDLLVAAYREGIRVYAAPGFELRRTIDFNRVFPDEDRQRSFTTLRGNRLVRFSFVNDRFLARAWPAEGGEPKTLGWWDPKGVSDWRLAGDSAVLLVRGREVFLRPLASLETDSQDRLVARYPDDGFRCAAAPAGDPIACIDDSGETLLWSTTSQTVEPLARLRGPEKRAIDFDPSGSKFAQPEGSGSRIWFIEGPPDAAPLVAKLPPGSRTYPRRTGFHPNGRWLVVKVEGGLFAWPLGIRFPSVLKGHAQSLRALAFSGDGTRLVTASNADSTVRLWPLSSRSRETARVLCGHSLSCCYSDVAVEPGGGSVVVSTFYTGRNRVFLVPIAGAGSSPVNLWPDGAARVWPVAFDPNGSRLAAGALAAESDDEAVIRIWNLETGDVQALALRDGLEGSESTVWTRGVNGLHFTPEGNLLSAGFGGIRRWDLDSGEGTWLIRTPEQSMMLAAASDDGQLLLSCVRDSASDPPRNHSLTLHDLAASTERSITPRPELFEEFALDPTGEIVATSRDGVIRVGLTDGSEPHLLLGHEGPVRDLAFSADGRWLASAGEDATVRLWPMPDLFRPPLHTLPQDELVAKLKSFTNLRAVRDPDSSTGWALTHEPFPGWAEVPAW